MRRKTYLCQFCQGELSMRNGKGVTIVVLANEGKESGTRIALGAAGVTIKMKQ